MQHWIHGPKKVCLNDDLGFTMAFIYGKVKFASGAFIHVWKICIPSGQMLESNLMQEFYNKWPCWHKIYVDINERCTALIFFLDFRDRKPDNSTMTKKRSKHAVLTRCAWMLHLTAGVVPNRLRPPKRSKPSNSRQPLGDNIFMSTERSYHFAHLFNVFKTLFEF